MSAEEEEQITAADRAAFALGARLPGDVLQLADLLTAHLRVIHDRSNLPALQLLFGLAFPGAPIPNEVAFAELSSLQRDVVHVVLATENFDHDGLTRRAVGECNLPNTREYLVAWTLDQLRLF
jgi:hypothetical protein